MVSSVESKGESKLLIGGDATAECNNVRYRLAGTTELIDDLKKLEISKGLTASDVSALRDFTDGWKMTMVQKMVSDGVANRRYGACFGVFPTKNGAVCQFITVSATAKQVAVNGH